MLKSLYIKNYALIDSLEIDFESGLSVITGETGAGKSIILGALSLILGQRADVKTLKKDEVKCVIEGVFDVLAYDLKAFCEEKGLEYDEHSYILRREILSSGKSRAFINDSPVSLGDLKELGSQFIDVHSQHQNLLLGDGRFQMQVVDIMADNRDLLKQYQISYRRYKQAEKELIDLKESILKSKEEEGYLRFQCDALHDAALKEGEQEELEQELEVLTHAEDIKTALYKVHLLLSDDDRGILFSLKDSLNASNSLSKVFAKSEEVSRRLESAYVELKDLNVDVQRFAEDIEFNPERLIAIQERLDLLYSLQAKHRASTVAELLSIYNELAEKISAIDNSDEELMRLEKVLSEKWAEVEKQAQVLSTRRKKVSSKLEKELVEKVSYLGMPNVKFECRIETKKHADLMGFDDVVFLFSANKNMPLQPVADTASGGEVSRIMLCLKALIAGKMALPTIIFDEIDTGVSGEIADKMGVIMKEMSEEMQVLVISHLPQIAAKGNAHYKVYKDDESETTTTHLIRLEESERIDEIARMLSGATITDAARENAKVMLGQ